MIIRGTITWDQREYRRRTYGNRCISFGKIPDGQARGEPQYREVPDSWRTSWKPTKRLCNAEQLTIDQKINYFERLK